MLEQEISDIRNTVPTFEQKILQLEKNCEEERWKITYNLCSQFMHGSIRFARFLVSWHGFEIIVMQHKIPWFVYSRL